MKYFLKKIWNILMWLRMTAVQLYSFAVIGGCSILI
ncbi:1-acyl-sn-glycerol-3-phosphate acyltransferase, partial [Francisella tularensis subsp. holarctica]|nr:1-acyl-sn-glycerol-3-phosphate acyltransferase [Francisella tularensis subsp. holarctica]